MSLCYTDIRLRSACVRENKKEAEAEIPGFARRILGYGKRITLVYDDGNTRNAQYVVLFGDGSMLAAFGDGTFDQKYAMYSVTSIDGDNRIAVSVRE